MSGLHQRRLQQTHTGRLAHDLSGVAVDRIKHRPEKILIAHIKLQSMAKISREPGAIRGKKRTAIEMSKDGCTYEL